jgi:heptosyltransferase-2
MEIALRAPNWIGDGIMALPAIRACRQAFPQDRLTVVVKNYLADVFLNVGEIDRILKIPDRWSARGYAACASRIRAHGFGRGILFTNSFSSALFFRLAGVRALSGYDRDGRGWLLNDPIPRADDGRHQRLYYLGIIEHVAGKTLPGPFAADLVISGAESGQAAALLSALGVRKPSRLLAIAPAAAYGSAKTWLPERFRALIAAWLESHPDSEIALLGSGGERQAIERIISGLPGPVHNLAGRLTLRQTIVFISRCRLAVCNDSGLMHVASSLNVPLLAIFGPTVHAQTAPLAGPFRLLRHGADCAPCRHRECPTDHRCMTAVTLDEVLAAAEELWQHKSSAYPGGSDLSTTTMFSANSDIR